MRSGGFMRGRATPRPNVSDTDTSGRVFSTGSGASTRTQNIASERVVTRGWVNMFIGAALLAGALVALCFPVYLGTYDRYGMQIKCGNGYYSQLLQATIDDLGQDPQALPVGASPAARATTNYVDQCESALMHRRAWVLPVAGLGALILISELLAWARARPPNDALSTSVWSTSPTDTTIQTAALLDRRACSHRARSSNTTL